jgi:flagellar protein FlaG
MRLDPVPHQPREAAAASVEPASPLPVASGTALPASGKNLPPSTTPPSVEALRKAAADIERFLRDAGHELSFEVDGPTGRMVISVRDPATGELIRQVPSEEALRIARNLDRALPTLIREQA